MCIESKLIDMQQNFIAKNPGFKNMLKITTNTGVVLTFGEVTYEIICLMVSTFYLRHISVFMQT